MKRFFQRSMTLLLVVMLLFMATFTVNLSATAETAKKSVDLVFAIDSTGSMRSYINSVKNNLTSFVREIEKNKLELNMAVVEYKDITSDGNASTIVHKFSDNVWTDDVNEVIDAFNNIRVSGGGDDPETPTDALQSILEAWEDNEAEKFVFLLTDAGFKDLGDTDSDGDGEPDHWNMDTCTKIMRDNSIKASVVSKRHYESDYNYLYTMTGGVFIDIDTENYYKLMQDFSNYIYETVTDKDGDGLPDEWEKNGVDYDEDGIVDVDLKAMGADPEVPDVFVEVDYMYKSPDKFLFWDVGEKRCELSNDAYLKVYNAFKSEGINLHIDAGPDSVMNYDTGAKWGDLSRSNSIGYEDIFQLGASYSNWNNTAINNFDKSRWTSFHYCLLVNKYQNLDGKINSSGIAENLPGQFFIVATSCINDGVTGQAGTFMHELGHTLGLSHGGLYYSTESKKIEMDHQRYKPNHISIMNYNYQFPGIKTVLGDSIVNYQNFELLSLDEDSLSEQLGIDPINTTYGMGLYIKYNKKFFESWNGIDFNRNGKIDTETVSVDTNPKEDIFTDHILTGTLNEWKNLRYNGNLIGEHGEDFDIDSITDLVTYHDDVDYREISIEEALENDVYGNEYECRINADNVNDLYAGIANQNLRIPIENLYNADTVVTLQVKSDILDKDFETKAELTASKESITQKICEAKVKDNLSAGTYNIDYVLTLENGEAVEQNGIVVVKDTEIKTVEVGFSEKLPVIEGVDWTSSNESVIQIADGKYVAKAAGKAFIYGIASNENYAFIVEVSEKSSETTEVTELPTNVSVPATPDSPTTSPSTSDSSVNSNVQTGDNTNLILWLSITLISFVGIIIVLVIVNKNKIK